MDLKIVAPPPTSAERAAVSSVLGGPSSGWDGGTRNAAVDGRSAHGGHAARDRRHLLLPVLHALQDRVGHLSEGGLAHACERLTVPPAEAWGVATFYALLATSERPPAVAHVCDDIACRANGAEDLCAAMEAALGPAGHPRAGAPATWLRSPCLGHCERAPAALVTVAGERPCATTLAPTTVEAVTACLARPAADDPPLSAAKLSAPQAGEPGLRLLARVGVVDPASLDAYRKSGGLAGLERALALGAEATVAEVAASKLVGRGGAAFPTGRKWDGVRRAPATPHHLVCNADESEPGTFKDRVLMEWDPFGLIEGMAIAGFATGCERGWIYLRGEYPLALRRLEAALAACRAAGVLGPRLLGRGPAFDVEIRRGAGAYICGEETALFNSIEGLRGEPRSKPPFPSEVGLFGKPTLVNNVETLANVPIVLAEGGAAFASVGSGASTGPKLYCLSGHLERPGLYETPFGATLRDLIRLAGGLRGGKKLQAALLGGAAGTFVGPDRLDTPLTFEGLRAVGASLGSGVIMAFDETADLLGTLRRVAAFFRDESCGQCVPCRVGTVRQEEALARIANGAPRASHAEEVRLVLEIGRVMKDASICGLGQTASLAVESGLALLDGTPGAAP